MFNEVIAGLIFCSLIVSCVGPRSMSKSNVEELENLILTNFDGADVHTGFILRDSKKKEKVLFDYKSDYLFTPASNTKILTFYASKMYLDKYLNGYKYFERNDTTYFVGCGDPGFLNQRFEDQLAFSELRDIENLVFVDLWNSDQRWGPGWSWDDYSYYYATERSIFPIYGNTVTFSSTPSGLEMVPGNFPTSVGNYNKGESVRRAESQNIFNIDKKWLKMNDQDTVYIPFNWSGELFASLLSDTLRKTVKLVPSNSIGRKMDSGVSWKFVNGSSRDTVLRKMMYDSDNFIAEQLLFNISSNWTNKLSSEAVIDTMFTSVLKKWKGKVRWVDGSGLSRYNAFSPRFISEVLLNLYDFSSEEELFSYFPAGGVRGTIQDWYGDDDGPFVFAKTGTLTGVHCLSGYVKTKSGRTLIFSFMHNGYLGSSSKYKRKMEIVLHWIRQNF